MDVKIIICSVFALWIIHWFLVQLYVYMCVPGGIWGALKSFTTLGSPVCNFINFLQYELSKNFISIWIAVGSAIIGWIVSKIAM